VTAFIANTNILELRGLKDSLTEAFINDADVTVTLKDEDGDEIGSVSWPISMSYVVNSDGDYRGVLSADLPLIAGTCYVAHIDADDGADRDGHWEFRFKPIKRVR
jgi:hypothetical protein